MDPAPKKMTPALRVVSAPPPPREEPLTFEQTYRRYARYVAAVGPSALGLLQRHFVEAHGDKILAFRYAGIVMCAIFLVGLLVLPFAPETKGQPLPE